MYKNSSVPLSVDDIEQLPSISYVLHGVVDTATGSVGAFAYDAQLLAMGCGYWAISPVFDSEANFYKWAKEAGFKYYSVSIPNTMLREFPA